MCDVIPIWPADMHNCNHDTQDDTQDMSYLLSPSEECVGSGEADLNMFP